MQEGFIYRYKKQIKIGCILVFVLIVAISVYFIVMERIYSATVNIRVTPTIAKVKIGDKTYKSMETYKVQPGSYDVEVSADGFVTKTGTLVAIENESVDVQMFLEPTEDNKDWYSEHQEDALILGEVKDYYALQAVQELTKNNPILNQLPIEIDYFTDNYAKRVRYVISYRLNSNNNDFVITIDDYTGGNYDDALAKLTARGVNLTGRVIEYTDKTADSEWGSAR